MHFAMLRYENGGHQAAVFRSRPKFLFEALLSWPSPDYPSFLDLSRFGVKRCPNSSE